VPFEGLQKLEYGYDPVGNVLSISDYNAGGTQTQSFAHDFLDRLTLASATGGSAGLYTETYTYNQIGNLMSKGGVSYSYGSSKPHAVTAVATSTFSYDANGNMITRTVADGSYALRYDVEGRLVEARKAGSPVASFGYDGDGKMVTATMGATTTVYLGNYYEKEGSTVRSYYYHGGQRVAMRENGTLYWLLTDHLGSTAVVANESGAKVAERRYRAFGQSRYDSDPLLPTDYRFTGQREESAIGLYFYNARWYDPALGRFAQADTVVPEPGNPQSLNRYSYVLNNPLKYMDPSGRAFDVGLGEGGYEYPWWGLFHPELPAEWWLWYHVSGWAKDAVAAGVFSLYGQDIAAEAARRDISTAGLHAVVRQEAANPFKLPSLGIALLGRDATLGLTEVSVRTAGKLIGDDTPYLVGPADRTRLVLALGLSPSYSIQAGAAAFEQAYDVVKKELPPLPESLRLYYVLAIYNRGEEETLGVFRERGIGAFHPKAVQYIYYARQGLPGGAEMAARALSASLVP
jgi:RHS repeat-associated protein